MTLTDDILIALSQTANRAALVAGQYIQSQFLQHYEKRTKAGGDSLASQVVTEVDLRAQEIILNELQPTIRQYDLGLLTEEQADDQSRFEKDYFWCIDPMDGTLPFTENRTGYAVSIALISKNGDPVIGVVYIPDLGNVFSAVKGNGILMNNQPFNRAQLRQDDVLHVYMDSSFQSESYYEYATNQLHELSELNLGFKEIAIHMEWGGVRNAIGVMSSQHACYFKYPKPRKGCGSIWDYAATRLLFEETNLVVANMKGQKLHLNQSESTFMNDGGILYATSERLADKIFSVYGEWLNNK